MNFIPIPKPTQKEIDRFIDSVREDSISKCWNKAYRTFYFHGRSVQAPRFAYAAFVGPLPDDKAVFRTCLNRHCVNPAHLELIDWADTPALSAKTRPRENHNEARKTHCPRGHEYDELNTLVAPDGRRRCVTCERAWVADKRERNRQERRRGI